MARQRESLLTADAAEPLFERAALQLHDTLARDAGQVVMMRVAAEAVRRLAASLGERVDRPVLGERLERPIDGREADPETAPAESHVEILGAGAVRLALELAQDGQPLNGRPQPGRSEELGVIDLRFGRHVT